MSNKHSESGFTLIELFVAMAISLIVATGVYEVYLQMNKSYTSQQMKVNLEQTARNALDTMSREISNAGYGGQMIDAKDNQIEFTEYISDESAVRQIRYKLVGTTILRGETDPASPSYDSSNEFVIANNVSHLVFSYFSNYTPNSQIYPAGDGKSPSVTIGANGATNIRQISVLLTMLSSKKDPTLPDDPVNHGHRVTVLKAILTPVNLAEGQGGVYPTVAPPANVWVWDNRDCSSLEVAWSQVTDPNLSAYEIQWGTGGGLSSVNVPVSQLPDPRNPKYKLTGLQITKYTDAAPTTYHIVVYSLNAVGLPGDASTEISGPTSPLLTNYTSLYAVQHGEDDTTLNARKPAPPTGGVTSTPAASQILLTWSPSAGATVGYRLYRSASQFKTFPISDSYKVADESVLIPGTTSYTDTVPLNCTDYYYAICSVNCDDTYIYGSTTKSGYGSGDYFQFTPAARSSTTTKPPNPTLAVEAGYNRIFVNLGNPLLTAGNAMSDSDFDKTIVYANQNALVPTNLDGSPVLTDQAVWNSSPSGTLPLGYFLQQGSGGDNYFVVDNWGPSNGTPSLDTTVTYYFLAVAYDRCGNFACAPQVSAQPTGFCPQGDSPPGAPLSITGLTASGCSDIIDLAWNANTESDLAGYRVYKNHTNSFGTALDTPDPNTGARGGSTCISGTFAIPTSATPTFADSTVKDGETDYYGVSATDCCWENVTNPAPSGFDYTTIKDHNISPITDVIGPIYPGRLRLYSAPIVNNPPSGTDMYNFVTTSGVNPADGSATAFHNAVTFYIQNTSAGNITLNNIKLTWGNQVAYLKKILVGGSPGTATTTPYTYATPVSEATAAGGETVNVDFSDISAKATGAGVYSQAIPITLVFTNSDGSVTSATDMNGDTLGVTLTYENNSTGSSFCNQSFTVSVPRGPRIYNSTVSIPDVKNTTPAFQDVSSMDPSAMNHPVAFGSRNTEVYALLSDQGQYAFQNGSTITMQDVGIKTANVYVAVTPQGARYPTGYAFQPVASITTNTAAGSVTGSITVTNNSIDAYIPPEDGNRVWYYFTAQDQEGNQERLPSDNNGYFMYDQTTWSPSPCYYQTLPPQSLTCTATPSGDVTLSWKAPITYTEGDDIVSPLYPSTALTQPQDLLTYQVYKKTGVGISYSATPSATTTSITYTDKGAIQTNNTTSYCYKIVAVNSCATSPKPSIASNEVVVSTPNPPSSVSATRSGNQSPNATLSWIAPGLNTDGNTLTNLSGFYIYLNGSLVATVSDPTATNYSYTTLKPGNNTLGVAAFNSYGVTSAVVTVTK